MNGFDGDLRELFTDENLSPTTAVYIYCPMHVDKRRPSMRVYSEGAKCFTCGAYLSRRALLEKVEPERITAAKLHSSGRDRKAARPELRVEEIRVLAQVATELLSPGERAYYEGRGLRPGTIDRYQLGHYGYGFTLPVFESEEGKVITVKFRRDDTLAEQTTPKYWGLRGHNEPRVYPWPVTADEPTIVLVEGEFDALLLRQAGVPAYTLTSGAGSWGKIDQTTFPVETRVVVLYDNDDAGVVATRALLEHLPKMGYEVSDALMVPPYAKDISDLLRLAPDLFRDFVDTIQKNLRETSWIPLTPQTTRPSAASRS